ncbi:phosphatase PAP2 family protein [Corynebacterium renale]|uniref:phosphatase PAP2 family protein n=1 Tax=Corynebacterium renale TaxID=1724 RepID=UPI000652DA5B|nr:phosphatase PAP2 family protein [Corynebacterium renale]
MANLEVKTLLALQGSVGKLPGVLPAARAMSFFGEHALGWMGLGAVGAVADKQRRRGWINVAVSAFISHAASVVIKRIVRRPRPHDPRIEIGVGTPSKLSFPSSHATSTTAALVALTYVVKNPAPLAGVPVMVLSRMVLGVHYPTDTIAGAALGAATALGVEKLNGKA